VNAPIRHTDFLTEFGLGSGWRSALAIGMTWLYFDESGEHAANGTLRRLTLGCGIAPFDAWQKLTPEWNDVLRLAGVTSFHMSDFEARKPPYDNWSNQKRRDVLNDLLEIAGNHIPMFCGYSGSHRDIVGKRQFQRAYRANLIKSLKETVLLLRRLDKGPVNLYFAKHKDISAAMIGWAIDFFNYWGEDRIRGAGFGNPDDVAALQVADLAAYEFSRTARAKRPDKERYPLLTLAARAKSFILYQAEEFDSEISVWGHAVPSRISRGAQ
jgi:hypothetical protein